MQQPRTAGYQGYVEGEFVNVAAPIAGRLDRLAVKRGDDIAVNARLYALEAVSEAAAQRQAEEQVRAAEAQLADLQLGRRPPEQDVTRAQLAQAQVDEQTRRDERSRAMRRSSAPAASPAHSSTTAARAAAAAPAKVAQLRSELAVAQLPSRGEQIKAQAAQVAAARAALEQAAWKLDQKSVGPRARDASTTRSIARASGWRREAPVVRILPPGNVKVRFFVPETLVGALAVGRAVAIQCDGCGADIPATLTYVSTEAEYTPPVIYSNETKSKLVFMIEARPAAGERDKAASRAAGQRRTAMNGVAREHGHVCSSAGRIRAGILGQTTD